MIAIDLNKQKALDANPKAIKQINFTGNLVPAGYTTMFFIIKNSRETTLDFSQVIMKKKCFLFFFFCFNIIQNDSI